MVSERIWYLFVGVTFLYHSYVSSDIITPHLAVEGNEKQIASHYFSMTNTSFDEATYYRQVSHCFTKPLSGMRNCIQPLHSQLFPNMRVWRSRNDRNPSNRSVDCDYEFTAKHWKSHPVEDNTVTNSYHFLISQTNCKSQWSELGGSTFLITAYDEGRLVACRYKDSLDNKYHVVCSFHRHNNELVNIPSCLNITILLDYEHFDAFSESLTGEASPYLNSHYNSLRHLLADNQQHCFDKNHRNDGSGGVSHIKPVQGHGSIQLITGEWISSDICNQYANKNCYLYLNGSLIQAYDNHQNKKSLSLLAKGKLVSDTNFPYMTRSINSKDFSSKYLFHPIIKTISSSDDRSQESNFHPTDITFNPFDHTKTIHFVGSSHIRFSFDSTAERFHLGYLPGGFTTVANMNSYHAGEDYSSIFADDQADGLRKICSTFKKYPTMNQTIIFMTGAWDLTFIPLRRLFHDPITANKLVKVMIQILDGTIKCPNLKHFIWLTEIPYSPCYDDNDHVCKVVKGFRTNGAIAALNEYYINALSNITVRSGLSFTIIDAYSIIAPRLQLLPDVEYDCSFHYHCKLYNFNHDPMDPLQLSHSPGGDAMVRAILLALSMLDLPEPVTRS